MTKIKILELDVTTISEQFTASSAGIWKKGISVPQAVQDAGFMTTVFGLTGTCETEPVIIGSVRVNNTLLGSVDSRAELELQDGAFFFNTATQVLYLALYDYATASSSLSYKVGQTSGFINKAQKIDTNMIFQF